MIGICLYTKLPGEGLSTLDSVGIATSPENLCGSDSSSKSARDV